MVKFLGFHQGNLLLNIGGGSFYCTGTFKDIGFLTLLKHVEKEEPTLE